MKTKSGIFSLIFCCMSTAFFAQFSSIGQQKLLVNPAFCASTEGLHVQALGYYSHYSSDDYTSSTLVNYTGASYAYKRFGFGLSNTYGHNSISSGHGRAPYSYGSNQTDLSIAYKINLVAGLTLVPSLQGSVLAYSSGDNLGNSSPEFLVASGLLLDIKKTVTLGAAFYNLGNGDLAYFHASALLFAKRQINFQPYVFARTGGGPFSNYIEGGAYTSYKCVALQTAYRSSNRYNSGTFIAGLSCTINRVKFGYTFSYQDGNTRHELFISMNLLKSTANKQRNLMMN